MLRFTLFLTVALASGLLCAQTDGQSFTPANFGDTFTPAEVITDLNRFGLPFGHELRHVYTHEQNGRQHAKYHQYYRDRRVLAGTVVFHASGTSLLATSGHLGEFDQLDLSGGIDPKQGEQIARLYVVNELIGEDIGTIGALELAGTEYAVANGNFPDRGGDYVPVLIYHLRATATELPVDREVIVEARTGRVLTTLSNIHTETVLGTGDGYYHPDLTFEVDSVAPDFYQLMDLSRGDGVIAYDLSRNGMIPRNDDNVWVGGSEGQQSMLDGYVAAQAYFDMLRDRFGRNSIDDQGFPLIANMNRHSFVNAYWDGFAATIGNGNCSNYSALVTYEIMSHEYTHGLTQNTSDLIYRDESGALNEAISDIFGKALEYYYDNDHFNWRIGEAIRRNQSVNYFRSMENPNARNHPRTYLGEDWYTGTRDNGGVHFNSGVLNHWFYLLVEGSRGVSEAGELFDVDPIGMDDAMALVYQLETSYLTEDSNYPDCYEYSLAAVTDLFGEDSPQEAAMREAWKAVGLPVETPPEEEEALEFMHYAQIITSAEGFVVCADDLQNAEIIVGSITNTVIAPGSQVFGRVVNTYYPTEERIFLDTVIVDTFELTEGLEAFDEFRIAGGIPADLPELLYIGSDLDLIILEPDSTRHGIRSQSFAAPSSITEPLVNYDNVVNNDLCGPGDISNHTALIEMPLCATDDPGGNLRIVFTGPYGTEETDQEVFPDQTYVFVPIPYRQVDRADLNRTAYEVFYTDSEGNEMLILAGDYRDYLAETLEEPKTYFLTDVEEARTEMAIRSGFGVNMLFENEALSFRDTNFVQEDVACIPADEFLGSVSTVGISSIRMCLNTESINDPHLSFDLQQFDNPDYSDEENEQLHITALYVDGELVGEPIVTTGGEERNFEFAIPETQGAFSGEVTLAVFSNDATTVIDNIRLSEGLASPTVEVPAANVRLTYNNPVTELLTVTAAGELPAGSVLRLHDTAGRLLTTQAMSSTTEVATANLPAGVYYLTATDGVSYRWTGKVVKAN